MGIYPPPKLGHLRLHDVPNGSFTTDAPIQLTRLMSAPPQKRTNFRVDVPVGALIYIKAQPRSPILIAKSGWLMRSLNQQGLSPRDA
jgi:hypothetical protein